MRRAFAGDDVAAEFRVEKQALVDAALPKEDDGFIPGWVRCVLYIDMLVLCLYLVIHAHV